MSQTHGDLSRLYREAQQAMPEMVSMVRKLQRKFGVWPVLPLALKPRDRAEQKIAADYGGDASRVRDLLRCRMVVKSLEQADAVLRFMQEEGGVVEVKDRFREPHGHGHRSLTVTRRFSNGHVGEVQIHLACYFALEKQTHKIYEEMRALQAEDAVINAGGIMVRAEDIRRLYGAVTAAYNASTRGEKLPVQQIAPQQVPPGPRTAPPARRDAFKP
jgi:hypothetical protein